MVSQDGFPLMDFSTVVSKIVENGGYTAAVHVLYDMEKVWQSARRVYQDDQVRISSRSFNLVAYHTEARYIHTDARYYHTEAQYTHTDAWYTHTDARYIHTDAQYNHTDARYIHTDARYIHTDAPAGLFV
jgi:hypothetical protein